MTVRQLARQLYQVINVRTFMIVPKMNIYYEVFIAILNKIFYHPAPNNTSMK